MFVSALSEIADDLRIVHFVNHDSPFLKLAPESLNDLQSSHWNAKVNVTLVLRRSGRTLWQRLLGLFDISYRAHYFPYNGPSQVAALAAHVGPKRLVFVHRLVCMCAMFRLKPRPKHIVVDFDDVEHFVALRTVASKSNAMAKIKSLLKVPAIIRAERKAGAISDRTFVCSTEDRDYLQRWGFGKKIVSIPNSVAMPSNCPSFTKEKTILFLGGYHYAPNSEAAERLITKIWPIIRQQVPSAKLMIAGNSPTSIPSFHARPEGVEFTGFVDDLDTLYARTRTICCPLINGGGTRLKLIEAATYAKPMVSTKIGAEGLSFDDGNEIIIREDDASLADACVKLLVDDALCETIGRAARRKAELMYDVRHIKKIIASEIAALNP